MLPLLAAGAAAIPSLVNLLGGGNSSVTEAQRQNTLRMGAAGNMVNDYRAGMGLARMNALNARLQAMQGPQTLIRQMYPGMFDNQPMMTSAPNPMPPGMGTMKLSGYLKAMQQGDEMPGFKAAGT